MTDVTAVYIHQTLQLMVHPYTNKNIAAISKTPAYGGRPMEILLLIMNLLKF